MVEVLEERSMAAFYVTLGFYIAAQMGVSVYAFVQNQEATEKDKKKRSSTHGDAAEEDAAEAQAEYNQHFSGGKSFGTVAVFLTYFSTAYSGYTVSGIPNEASSTGFFTMWWLSAFNLMNLTGLVWKPRLRRVSAVRNWVAYQDPINDRYNNRLVTMLYVLCGVGGQAVYVVVQLFSMRQLLATITPEEDQFDVDAMVWIMAAIILFAEVIGGMTAVVLTDSVQSSIMIVSMILVPIIATVHYKGAGSSFAPDCANLQVLNCTMGTPLYERGANCKGKVIHNGCLGHPDGGSPWLTLHPSVGMSEYFKPIWATPDGRSWPEYQCVNSTDMCENPLPGSEVLKATRGVDGSWIFNRGNFNYAGMCMNFISVGFMPNYVARFFIAKSDKSLKVATIVQILIGGAIATVPAILLGVMVSANLKNQYPAGSAAFGMVVSDFNSRGGFNQFVAVMASVAAIAAFMSTADSSIISITTMLSTELLQNGLFKVAPQYNNGKTMKVFACVVSFTVLLISTLATLYDPEINDPESLAYAHLGTFQNLLFSYCAVPQMCLLFLPKTSGWAILGGMIASMATFFGLWFGKWGTNVGTDSYTPFAPDPNHILFFGYLWAFFANLAVAVPLSFIDLDRIIGIPQVLQVNTTNHDPDGQPLTIEQIWKAMEHTTEVFKDKIGIACIAFTTVSVFVSIPQWGESYDDCNYMSYIGWFNGDGSPVDGCSGPTLCGGIPCWVVPSLILVPINKCVIAFAYTRWKTDDRDQEVEQMQDEPVTGNGKTVDDDDFYHVQGAIKEPPRSVASQTDNPADRVRAALTNGSYVNRKEATQLAV